MLGLVLIFFSLKQHECALMILIILSIIYISSLTFCLYILIKGFVSEDFFNTSLRSLDIRNFQDMITFSLLSLLPVFNTALAVNTAWRFFSISEKINNSLPEHIRD